MTTFTDTITTYRGGASIRPCYWQGLDYLLRDRFSLRDIHTHVFIFHIEQGAHTLHPGEEWKFAYVWHTIGGVDKNKNVMVHITVAPVQRVEEKLRPRIDSDHDECVEETRSGSVVVRRDVYKIMRTDMELVVNDRVMLCRVMARADMNEDYRNGALPSGILEIRRLGYTSKSVEEWCRDKKKTLGKAFQGDARKLLPPLAPMTPVH